MRYSGKKINAIDEASDSDSSSNSEAMIANIKTPHRRNMTYTVHVNIKDKPIDMYVPLYRLFRKGFRDKFANVKI